MTASVQGNCVWNHQEQGRMFVCIQRTKKEANGTVAPKIDMRDCLEKIYKCTKSIHFYMTRPSGHMCTTLHKLHVVREKTKAKRWEFKKRQARKQIAEIDQQLFLVPKNIDPKKGNDLLVSGHRSWDKRSAFLKLFWMFTDSWFLSMVARTLTYGVIAKWIH